MPYESAPYSVLHFLNIGNLLKLCWYWVVMICYMTIFGYFSDTIIIITFYNKAWVVNLQHNCFSFGSNNVVFCLAYRFRLVAEKVSQIFIRMSLIKWRCSNGCNTKKEKYACKSICQAFFPLRMHRMQFVFLDLFWGFCSFVRALT